MTTFGLAATFAETYDSGTWTVEQTQYAERMLKALQSLPTEASAFAAEATLWGSRFLSPDRTCFRIRQFMIDQCEGYGARAGVIKAGAIADTLNALLEAFGCGEPDGGGNEADGSSGERPSASPAGGAR
jgi:hypothetical protein